MLPALTLMLFLQAPVQPAPVVPTLRDPWWTHVALVGYGVGQMTDISTSMYLFGAGQSSEANPLLRPFQRRPVAMGIAKGAMASAVAIALLRAHEDHPKTAFAVAVALTCVQGWVSYHNAKQIR